MYTLKTDRYADRNNHSLRDIELFTFQGPGEEL